MPREKICKRCHSELEIKYNEYGSYNRYICPACHKEYASDYIEGEPFTTKELLLLPVVIFVIVAIPAAIVLYAHYYLSVYQAAAFILGVFFGIPLLIFLALGVYGLIKKDDKSENTDE